MRIIWTTEKSNEQRLFEATVIDIYNHGRKKLQKMLPNRPEWKRVIRRSLVWGAIFAALAFAILYLTFPLAQAIGLKLKLPDRLPTGVHFFPLLFVSIGCSLMGSSAIGYGTGARRAIGELHSSLLLQLGTVAQLTDKDARREGFRLLRLIYFASIFRVSGRDFRIKGLGEAGGLNSLAILVTTYAEYCKRAGITGPAWSGSSGAVRVTHAACALLTAAQHKIRWGFVWMPVGFFAMAFFMVAIDLRAENFTFVAVVLSLCAGFMSMIWQATQNEAKTLRELGGRGQGAALTYQQFDEMILEAKSESALLKANQNVFRFTAVA